MKKWLSPEFESCSCGLLVYKLHILRSFVDVLKTAHRKTCFLNLKGYILNACCRHYSRCG